jgi:erythromycin esterase-like protein
MSQFHFVSFSALLYSALLLVATEVSALPCLDVNGEAALAQRSENEVLFLGEVHGTAEIPKFVANVVCWSLESGRGVTLAVEMPRDEQLRIQRYLLSSGSEADRDGLIDSSYWRSERKDGRTSKAIVQLIDSVRHFRSLGADVAILAIDESWSTQDLGIEEFAGSSLSTRNLSMASRLMASAIGYPSRRLIVLTGSYHAAKQSRDAGITSSSSSATVLSWLIKVRSVGFVFDVGERWACIRPDVRVDRTVCGKRSVDAKYRFPGLDEYVELGQASASDPMVLSTQQRSPKPQ